MWTSVTGLEAFINALRAANTELDAFKVQHTVYGIFIALEAILCDDAQLVGNDTYMIDGISYGLGGGIPPALIGIYGLLEESGADLAVPALLEGAVSLLQGFHIVRWADELTRMEDAFGVVCAERPEWNYYGAIKEDGILSDEWMQRISKLQEEVTKTVVDPAVPEVAPELNTVPSTVTSNRNRTRRLHGRRALTPIRSRRSIALTKRRH